MSFTKIAEKEEFYKAVKDGIKLIYGPVSDTLGAKGRTVLINETGKGNSPSKDGYKVSMSIRPEDNLLAAGAKIIQDATSQSVTDAGDGTTTTTILTSEMILEGIKHVTAGASPIDLQKGINMATEAVVEHLKKHATPVKGKKKTLEHVATVSANNDKSIGLKMAEGLHKVGLDGIMKFDMSEDSTTYLEYKQGIGFDEGYISSHLQTDPDGYARYKDAYVLISEDVVTNFEELMPALTIAGTENKPLVVVASDFIAEVPASIVTNRLKHEVPILAVRAYGRDSLRSDLLDDIATITGGKLISKNYGRSLKNVTKEDLGMAKLAEANAKTCQIIGHGNVEARVKNMLESLNYMVKEAKDEKSKVALKSRISRLKGLTAYMYIGAASEQEQKEKIDRIEDSLRATRAAMEDGVVPGGGVALLRSSEALEYLVSPEPDVQAGIDIVKSVLDAPIEKMMDNAGLKRKDVLIDRVLDKDFNFGYNLQTDTIEDFYKSGILDPVKVVRVAIETAASVAGTILNTKYIIYEG